MTKGAVGESLQKGQKRERSSNEKMPRNWQKRERKSAAAQSKNAEISARKAQNPQNVTDWTQQNVTKIQVLNIL